MTPIRAGVWVAPLPPPGDDAGCSPAELRRAAGMGSAPARERYLGSRSVLRRVLGARLGEPPSRVALQDRRDAAPRMTDHPGLHLGLSHANGVVAVALSADGPLGIDIEAAGSRSRPVPAAALDPAKLDATRAVVGAELAPLGAWVAQEAALKLAGLGLAVPLADVIVTAGDPGLRVRVGDRGTAGVILRARPGGLVVGVAAWDVPPTLTWHTWEQTEQTEQAEHAWVARSTGGA